MTDRVGTASRAGRLRRKGHCYPELFRNLWLFHAHGHVQPQRGLLVRPRLGRLQQDLGSYAGGIDAATARARAGDLLALMDLEDAGSSLVTDFSHGMRKKLSLAAALLPAPKLLFLDEPFEGIDAVASRQIKDLLQSFVSRGGTIFLTSHILEIVERLSTHIGVIAKGRLVAQGEIGALRAGGASGATLEELFIRLVGGEASTALALDWL